MRYTTLATLVLTALVAVASAPAVAAPKDPNAISLAVSIERSGGGEWHGTFKLTGALSESGTVYSPYSATAMTQYMTLTGANGTFTFALDLGEPVYVGKGKGGFQHLVLLSASSDLRGETGAYAGLPWIDGWAGGVYQYEHHKDPTREKVDWSMDGTLAGS